MTPRRLYLLLVVSCATVALMAAPPAGAAPDAAKQALRTAKRLAAGGGARPGRELPPALRLVYAKLPQLHGADRRRAERLLQRPTQGQGNPGEEQYTVPEAPPVCGTHFCIHYVATTADAPSL